MQQNSMPAKMESPFCEKENKAQSRQSASGLGDAKDVFFISRNILRVIILFL